LVTVGSPVLAGCGAALGDGVGVGVASAVVSVWAAVSVVLAPPGPISLGVTAASDSVVFSVPEVPGPLLAPCSLPAGWLAVPASLEGVFVSVPDVDPSVIPSGVKTTTTPLSVLELDSPSAAAIAVIVQSITSKSSMLTAFFPYLFIFLVLLPQDSHKGFSSNYTTDPVIKQQAAVGVDKLPLPVYIRLIYYAVGFFIAERQAWSSSKPQRNTENVLFWPV
jgi:hypothetical protein